MRGLLFQECPRKRLGPRRLSKSVFLAQCPRIRDLQQKLIATGALVLTLVLWIWSLELLDDDSAPGSPQR